MTAGRAASLAALASLAFAALLGLVLKDGRTTEMKVGGRRAVVR